MEMNFEVGQIVRCVYTDVYSSFLTVGKLYRVTDIKPDQRLFVIDLVTEEEFYSPGSLGSMARKFASL
jgi:hypothetical protein